MAEFDQAPSSVILHSLGGVEVLVGRYRGHAIPRHVHDGLMLAYVRDGALSLQCDGQRQHAGANAVLAVAPNRVHAVEPVSNDGRYYQTVTIPSGVMERYQRGSSLLSCDNVIVDGRLGAAIAAFVDGLGTATALDIELLLYSLLDAFLPRQGGTSGRRAGSSNEIRAVRVSKDYLYENSDRNVTLDELSRVANIDQFLLVRSFTKQVGLPPHAWHLQCRLWKGLALLAEGLGVADVAAATGFADQAHLTRVCRRVTAITPGRFRKDNVAFRARSMVATGQQAHGLDASQ